MQFNMLRGSLVPVVVVRGNPNLEDADTKVASARTSTDGGGWDRLVPRTWLPCAQVAVGSFCK